MSQSLERFKNKSSTYLAPLENADGKLDFEAHKVVEVLDRELKESPGYIGVVPIGSMVRGYATDDSDVDVVVMRDGSGLPDQPLEGETRGRAAAADQTKRKLSYIEVYPSRSDVQKIVDLAKRGDYIEKLWMHIFSPAAIGPKIVEYRDMVRKILALESDIIRNNTIERIAQALVASESRSHSKVAKRVPELDDKAHDEIYRERNKLWQRQIRAILG